MTFVLWSFVLGNNTYMLVEVLKGQGIIWLIDKVYGFLAVILEPCGLIFRSAYLHGTRGVIRHGTLHFYRPMVPGLLYCESILGTLSTWHQIILCFLSCLLVLRL